MSGTTTGTTTGPDLVDVLRDLLDRIDGQALAHYQAGRDLMGSDDTDDRDRFQLEMGACDGLHEAHGHVMAALKAAKR